MIQYQANLPHISPQRLWHHLQEEGLKINKVAPRLTAAIHQSIRHTQGSKQLDGSMVNVAWGNMHGVAGHHHRRPG